MGDHSVKVAVFGGDHQFAVTVTVSVRPGRLIAVDRDVGEVSSEGGSGVVLGGIELTVEILVCGRHPPIAGMEGTFSSKDTLL